MLEIKNLTVSAGSELILKDVSLKVEDNQKVVLFGPNGSGKSTLFKVIMGLSKYKIKQGEIFFNGKKINSLTIDKRNQLGLAMMFQQPPTVNGVNLKKLVQQVNPKYEKIKKTAKQIKVSRFFNQGINSGLSGGEQKRSELFQLMVDTKAKLYLFDEPDSGVDVENLQLVGSVINDLLKEKSGLIITHTGHILDYISSDLAYVMIDGQIVCSGKPKLIFKQIKDRGYSECFSCEKGGPNE
jgi:Fe-S cluster assembly ATP-binding protein